MNEKRKLYKTARATIACAAFPKDAFVSVDWSDYRNNVHWFKINKTQNGTLESPVWYPEHHLTNFVL